MQDPNFNPSSMFYIFDNFDYVGLADTLDQELTPQQKSILKFIKQFDEEMEVRKEER